jgi:hypothetical protein
MRNERGTTTHPTRKNVKKKRWASEARERKADENVDWIVKVY